MTNHVEIAVTDRGETAVVEVIVNGDPLGAGVIGGEPEDNYYFRDYDWIDSLLGQLAKALGAEVIFSYKEE